MPFRGIALCLTAILCCWAVQASAEGFVCAGSQGTFAEDALPAEVAAKPARIAQSGTTGTRRALVLFARFKGESTTLPSWAADIFNPTLAGSFSHFYDTMSFGKLQVRGEVAPRVYESSQPASAYLSSDPTEQGRFGLFTQEVLRQADQDIDFAQFDDDGPDGIPNSGDDDGVVDAVFIVMERIPAGFLLSEATGISQLGTEDLQPTADAGATGQPIEINPKQGTIQQGRFFAETVGAMCHEYGHVLGLPDLYNTAFSRKPGAGPEEDSAGVGAWCLMGWGALGWLGDDGPNSFCAWSRVQLGWAQVVEVINSQEEMRLSPVGSMGEVYKVPLDALEYFLLEHRTRGGTYYDRNIPGEGLLVWHISTRDRVVVDLEGADGKWRDAGYPLGKAPDSRQGGDNLDFWAHDLGYTQLHAGNLGDATDPFDGVQFRSFTPETNPASYSYDGHRNVQIEAVRFEDGMFQLEVQTAPLLLQLEGLQLEDASGDSAVVAEEEVRVHFRLANRGGVKATGLKAVLSSRDTLVELMQAEVPLKDLEIGAKFRGSDFPRFRLADGFTGTHNTELVLEIYAGEDVIAQAPIYLTVISPHQLIQKAVVVDDSGNGDGKAQPGEFIRLAVEVGIEASALLPLLGFSLRPLDERVLLNGSAEVVFASSGGPLVPTLYTPEFLVPALLAPGDQLEFVFEATSSVSTWKDTLALDVEAGTDHTPPRVDLPLVARQEAGFSVTLPQHLILDASPIRSASALVYSAADTVQRAMIPLQWRQDHFEGIWTGAEPGIYLVAAEVVDQEGNRGQSGFREVDLRPPREEARSGSLLLGKGQPIKVRFSPDGQLLAAVSSVGVWRYEAATLREIGLLKEVNSARDVDFSKDGSLLVTYTYSDGVVVWDLAARRELPAMKSETGFNDDLAISPDGKWVAAAPAGERTVAIWDVMRNEEAAALTHIGGDISALDFSPDGRLLALGTTGKTVNLWRVGEWRKLAVMQGHTKPVHFVEFSPDGQVLASIGEGEDAVQIWEVAHRRALGSIPYGSGLEAATFSPDGHLLAMDGGDGVHLWDVDAGQLVGKLAGGNRISSAAFSPDGQVLAGIGYIPEGYEVQLWDAKTLQPLKHVGGYTKDVRSVAFSPDGKTLAAGYNDAVIRLWNTADYAQRAILKGDSTGKLDFQSRITALAYSPDSRLLAAAEGNGGVQLWDVLRAELVGGLKEGDLAPGDPIEAMAFIEDQPLLVVVRGNGDSSLVRVWDVIAQQQVASFKAGSADLAFFASTVFSMDGRLLALGRGKSIEIWDTGTHQSVIALEGQEANVRVGNLAFSPDKRLLASAWSDKMVRLWDLAARSEVGIPMSGAVQESSLSFNPSGSLLAVATPGLGISIWRVPPQPAEKAFEFMSSATTLAFSPDGKTLVSGSGRLGVVVVWQLEAPTAVEEEGQALPGRFVLDPNYPNPFNPTTTLRFSLPKAGEAELSIYNLLGQRVATLMHGAQEAGPQVLQWDGRDEYGKELASGVYLYRLQAGGQVETRKLLLLR